MPYRHLLQQPYVGAIPGLPGYDPYVGSHPGLVVGSPPGYPYVGSHPGLVVGASPYQQHLPAIHPHAAHPHAAHPHAVHPAHLAAAHPHAVHPAHLAAAAAAMAPVLAPSQGEWDRTLKEGLVHQGQALPEDQLILLSFTLIAAGSSTQTGQIPRAAVLTELALSAIATAGSAGASGASFLFTLNIAGDPVGSLQGSTLGDRFGFSSPNKRLTEKQIPTSSSVSCTLSAVDPLFAGIVRLAIMGRYLNGSGLPYATAAKYIG